MKPEKTRTVIGLLPSILLIAACGAVPLKVNLPEEIRAEKKTARLNLGSRGHIFAAVKLGKGTSCNELKEAIHLALRRVDRVEKIPVEYSCLFVPGYAALHSAVLNKGEYEANYSVTLPKKKPETSALLSVRYRDPDFESGADQDFGGATELGENQTIKNTVSYTAGDDTDWIKVKGKGGKVALNLRSDVEGGQHVTAHVYRLTPHSPQPSPAGTLVLNKPRILDADASTELLVKIVSPLYVGESAYSISRRDLSSGIKRVALSVLDCYPMTETSSIVLLRASEGLNQNDGVDVFGIDARGRSQKLGQCRVEQVADGQASCLLNRVVPRNVVEYRAEAFLGGKS